MTANIDVCQWLGHVGGTATASPPAGLPVVDPVITPAAAGPPGLAGTIFACRAPLARAPLCADRGRRPLRRPAHRRSRRLSG
ncbi:hypothetical protein [Frankia casuarinae]|uniref:hypothetical protein n=1 Tax=Frankia casuarinae (strain DSM 45818 / CECT 9043 / HFP020203 / CcI3) TaxID=106370 RepID=UPI00041CCE4F|nr:hypothetical protein [Frankia casuarinae]